MSKVSFKSLLASLPVGLAKSAAIESPDEMQMEQDFAQLAYTFLKDRAPGLMPYILGFEVVDREEDGSKAVGIFGFKIGKDYYYVPAFFVNNQIKGMDLLFAKSTNMFMPLKEQWVNHIVNRQTIQLGGPANETDSTLRRQFEQPNFDFLAEPPMANMNKTSSTNPDIDTVGSNGVEVWNDMQQAIVTALEKDAAFQKAWAGAIARLEKSELPFAKTAEDSSLINWLEKKGGVRAVNVLLRTLTENKDFAKAAFSFYPSVDSLFVTKFAEELQPIKQAAKVVITTQVTEYMDGESKKRLVRDGFTIQDSREPAEKSEVYDVDYVKHFTSPTQAGTYDLLLRDGNVIRAWVFNVVTGDKSTQLVVDTKGQNYFLAESGAIFVRDGVIDEDASAYDKAVSLDSMKIGNCYVLVNDKGDSTAPFSLDAVITEAGKRIKLKVNFRNHPKYNRPTYGHDFETLSIGDRYNKTDCKPWLDYIQIADFNGRKLSIIGNDTVLAPKNWKALQIEESGNSDSESYQVRSLREDYFKPGTLSDVSVVMAKSALHQLDVCSDDGLEYYTRMDGFMDGKPMNYKSAMVRLVGKYALAVEAAEQLLKEAKANFKCRRTVKLAQSPMVGAFIPPEMPQTYGTDDFTGVPVMNPQAQNIQGYTMGQTVPQNTMQPGFNLGGEAAMDMQATGLAQQAAMAGQKEVFDHSSIGGLAKVYDTAAIVDSYVPELMKSLDRLGRILFLFYWKNEDFAERYGSEDLAEMEDTLRGVFKNYGDLVLQLRQKTIGSEETKGNVI